jgi:pimeloyl-ACP methyl ester carboxylesterase
MQGLVRRLRPLIGICVALGALAVGTPAALAAPPPALSWHACGTAAGVQCTTVPAPRDYRHRRGATVKLFVARSPATDPAHRIGSLFVNFGGPGATAADTLESAGTGEFPVLNRRFDIVAMDPRGVGQSQPSIDCKVNQEALGLNAQPFTTPFNLNVRSLVAKDERYIQRCLALNSPAILAHGSTANVARDMNLVRGALGEHRLNYLGFSYGSFLGATFASLFPYRYRAMVLDGPLDASEYVNRPLDLASHQAGGLELALSRFLKACAADQTACHGFGGADPPAAYDRLAAQLDRTPLPATGYPLDPRPVNGDDLRVGTAIALYSKQAWPVLAGALGAAKNGDGSLIRLLTDFFYFRLDDGSYDPSADRYFALTGDEARFPRAIGTYLRAGRRSYARYKHFWVFSGYSQLSFGLYPIRDRDAYHGPFRVPRSAPTPLVVATTFDPATPYPGALRLVRQLRNARLLTMNGDGHTAYGNGSPTCIDTGIESYLTTGALPAVGTVCQQNVPFGHAQPATTARAGAASGAARGLPPLGLRGGQLGR